MPERRSPVPAVHLQYREFPACVPGRFRHELRTDRQRPCGLRADAHGYRRNCSDVRRTWTRKRKAGCAFSPFVRASSPGQTEGNGRVLLPDRTGEEGAAKWPVLPAGIPGRPAVQTSHLPGNCRSMRMAVHVRRWIPPQVPRKTAGSLISGPGTADLFTAEKHMPRGHGRGRHDGILPERESVLRRSLLICGRVQGMSSPEAWAEEGKGPLCRRFPAPGSYGIGLLSGSTESAGMSPSSSMA